MNRAKRYSGMTLTFAVVISLIAGIILEQAVISSNRKPEIRTVIQAPSLTEAKLADDLANCQSQVRALKAEQPIVTQDFSAPSNREGHPTAVTPQPYSLHPGKTPLIDPTQDAYYRSLLREGRFPTTGSGAGRP